MEKIASNKCFGGEQLRYRHHSKTLSCEMTFSIYLPPQVADAGGAKLPVLYWLSGLTCNDENFVQKAGAQRVASELGIVLVTADTSPRGEDVPDDPEGAYDLGLGAGFYLNATEKPWSEHYRMYDYIVDELPSLLGEHFPIDTARQSISGHSMGGHGALTIALKNLDSYKSVSVFAPIVSPINCPWGQKALKNYLGDDPSLWESYDSVCLIKNNASAIPMLIHQGSSDQFLEEQLKPELLIDACEKMGFPLNYQLKDGHDHSYFFIATFIEEHLRFHAKYLNQV